MPKRAREESGVECFGKSPQKSEDMSPEHFKDKSSTNNLHESKKRGPRSKKLKSSAAFSKPETRNVVPFDSPVDLILESSFSSENPNEPSGTLSQSNQSNKDLESLLSLSNNCKEHLMHIVSTAIQFQRHSHHPKLCSSHFTKALAMEEDLNHESDDSDDFQDLKDVGLMKKDIVKETEQQPITCHGRWLIRR